jgi:hypothetical protein
VGREGLLDAARCARHGVRRARAPFRASTWSPRAQDFRAEKTKKKRGTYRGGVIDSNAVNSFKFE